MNLKNARILLTGASGGIGHHLSTGLSAQGARLCLVDRSQQGLQSMQDSLDKTGWDVCSVTADISNADDRQRCVQTMLDHFEGIDILINLAGTNAFTAFEEQGAQDIEQMMQVNAIAPMLMTHQVLPHMRAQNKGQIVNIGSTYGSIAFPCYVSYSSSKFALRGFSQALRRELAGSGVNVTYVAPRGVDTPLNPPAVYAMAQQMKMAFDKPQDVAREIIKAIVADNKEKYIGFPESLFVRINAILPGVVDSSLNKQGALMRSYANGEYQTKES